MGYEVFARTTTRLGVPAVRLSKGGRIALNATATRLLRTEGVNRVLLLWNHEAARFAIRIAEKKDSRAHELRFMREYSVIYAKAFLAHIGWTFSHTETLVMNWNEKEKMFEVQLPRSQGTKERHSR